MKNSNCCLFIILSFIIISFFSIGIGQKANDSLANIFDTTGHEDYESCPQDETSALEKEYVLENEEEEEWEEQNEGMKHDEQMEEDGEEAQFMDGKDF